MSLADPGSAPTQGEIDRALARFARDITRHYGSRLRGLFLFGSRARGDSHPCSDLDVAVVIDDANWDFWTEKMQLADLEYDTVVATGVDVQGWPVSTSDWRDPQRNANPSLILAMQRDGKDIGAPLASREGYSP